MIPDELQLDVTCLKYTACNTTALEIKNVENFV
jgi:hypothetical protein